MRACHCTLPYSNPNACEACPNNNEMFNIKPFIWTQPPKNPWEYKQEPVQRYITGKWYIVTYTNGLQFSQYICFCVRGISDNYSMINENKSFVFDAHGRWIDQVITYTTGGTLESAYVLEAPFDSKEEAEKMINRTTLKTTVPEKKEEKKMKNAMEDEVFNDCADKIVELLLDSGKTFTPHIVTQILRKTDAFVEHQKVREYFDNADEQGWTDFDYAVGYAYVNNSPTKSRVYYLEIDDLNLDEIDRENPILMDIKDFETEMKAFLGWFNSEYEYEEGTDSKAPDWNISNFGPTTYTWPNDGTTKIVWDLGKENTDEHYIKGSPQTITVKGVINKPADSIGISGTISLGNVSGGTVASKLPDGVTSVYTRNAGWDNHKNQKRGPDGKWIKQ